MKLPARILQICVVVGLGLASEAQAELFTSSASSASPASSASVSDSLSGSSESSRDTKKTVDGDYRITDVDKAPERPGMLRLKMQAENSPGEGIVLDLPTAVLAEQKLGRGDLVHAEKRVYGLQFARTDTRQAFFLVLGDDWQGDLAPHPVTDL